MSKVIETDLRTFIKFWLVPLGIGLVIFSVIIALVFIKYRNNKLD